MWEVGRTQSSIGKSMLLLAQFSGIWEIFSLFTALLFTSSEVDELEKSNKHSGEKMMVACFHVNILYTLI